MSKGEPIDMDQLIYIYHPESDDVFVGTRKDIQINGHLQELFESKHCNEYEFINAIRASKGTWHDVTWMEEDYKAKKLTVSFERPKP